MLSAYIIEKLTKLVATLGVTFIMCVSIILFYEGIKEEKLIEFLGLTEGDQWDEFCEHSIFIAKYEDIDLHHNLFWFMIFL